MKRTTLAAALFALLPTVPPDTHAQQRDFSQVQIKATKVAGNVYMLEGAGGNIGVSAGEDGLLIVDDQFAPLADKIRAALKQINPGPLRFVLNTHFHGDHTGGNAQFGKESTIVAHDNVRKRLASPQRVAGQDVPASPREALPVVTYAQSVSIHFNGEEIRVIHLPTGHTDGDSAILFTASNVAHLGDHFFAGRFPFVDIDSGGSVQGLTRNIADLIARLPADVRIIPGHGPLSTMDDLKTYHRMLTTTTDHVRKHIDAGRTVEQIKAAGLPDEWKQWGTGFINQDRWLETIHRSLTRPAGAAGTDKKHH
ncbi:MAG TPA: MBL fold metallo-hydrolase [Pyrinomonadaceae bacterium]|nr:MBL fold metallo-hydrolase [Pyrinomonadaceae bacterium]